jgi:hypothetical protein
MTIEAGPKPNGVRTAAADNRNQKNKPAAADSPGGSFGAILASMDSSETAVQPVVNAVDENVSSETLPGATTLETNRAKSAVKGLLPSDATTVRELCNGQDALALSVPELSIEFEEFKKLIPEEPLDALATVMLPVVDAAVVSTLPPLDVVATTALPSAEPVVVSKAVPMDSSVTVALPVVDAAAVSKPVPLDTKPLDALVPNGSSSNIQNSQSEGKNSFASEAQLGLVSIKPGSSAVKLESVPALPLAWNEPPKTPETPGKIQSDIGAKQLHLGDTLTIKDPPVARELESRLPPLAAKSVEQTAASIAVNLAAASSIMPVRRDDQTRERSVFRSNTAEGSVFGQSYLSTSAATTVQYTPQLQMSTDVFVAEKVAYWISNDVQNAELKLDGIGLDPVEVSIRMHGNEAHVAFRTDELQARAALENASTHLKELLQREGLVLTGVSVGTAGAGNSGDREGKPRQGTRQTNISVDSDLAARSGPVAGRTAGGRLDLFV